MPNYCSNAIVVKSNGSKEAERELVEFFERIDSTKGKSQSGIFSEFVSGKYMDSSEWRSDNWGTGWDIGHKAITFVTENHMTFETSWSPPIQWVLTVSKEYPRLIFEIAFSEMGMSFAGVIEAQDGEVLSEDEVEVGWTPDEDEWLDANPDKDEEYFLDLVRKPNAEWLALMDKYKIEEGG